MQIKLLSSFFFRKGNRISRCKLIHSPYPCIPHPLFTVDLLPTKKSPFIVGLILSQKNFGFPYMALFSSVQCLSVKTGARVWGLECTLSTGSTSETLLHLKYWHRPQINARALGFVVRLPQNRANLLNKIAHQEWFIHDLTR